jgi:hypothetical protein
VRLWILKEDVEITLFLFRRGATRCHLAKSLVNKKEIGFTRGFWVSDKEPKEID